MIYQYLLNLVELCVQKGVQQAIISPGSRSAPLTLALARHPQIKSRVIVDERSAGFIALGIAQQLRQPVILVCTSGSAAYNLAPAIAEAYFQEIPLLVLTADRPKEWLHQQDGQTINQSDLYGQHVKQSIELPVDVQHADSYWFVERIANEFIDLARTWPQGPVHLNIPLREPLYPTEGERFEYGPVRLIEQLPFTYSLSPETWHRLQDAWDSADRKLIAVGQGSYDGDLLQILKTITDEWDIPVIGDLIANVPENDRFITRHDIFLQSPDENRKRNLVPDLLVTVGQSFLSKPFKNFLRTYKPRLHWHIQPHGRLADPFQTITSLIRHEPTSFFKKLFVDIDYQQFVSHEEESYGRGFFQQWQQADHQAGRLVHQFLAEESGFYEWAVVEQVLVALPIGSQLHLANSMPVRYATLVGIRESQQITIFANRGTSGIDGCLSTAVGAALVVDTIVTVLIGDGAFFYDRNALWNQYVPPNLRIVVLNNHAGNIFRMIEGPSHQPELEPYFEVVHSLNAQRTAEDAGLDYSFCRTNEELQVVLLTFFHQSEQPKILEVETDRITNAEKFHAFKQWILDTDFH